jgi:copper(I)-binding protein
MNMHKLTAVLALICLAYPLSQACAGALDADLRITDAWIRWLPAGLPGAGYLTIDNEGSEARAVIGASSPDYAQVELHQSRSSDGMAAMTPLAQVVVKPHLRVRFAEGGYHLMLMRPKREIRPGDKVLVILKIDGGRSITVPFEVRGSPPAG